MYKFGINDTLKYIPFRNTMYIHFIYIIFCFVNIINNMPFK